MSERVLLVDDEPRLLDGLRRSLRGRYVVSTATSGPEGLTAITESLQEGNPFAVVVSDMQMPGMSGAEFLGQVRTLAPDAVLMVLSGQADLTSTISAVNNASLFRFLTKPCDTDNFTRALDDALRQHHLVMAERELLQNTLTSTVNVLTEVLAMASPAASLRTERLRTVVQAAAQMLGLDDDWRLPIAAMLSHVGCIAVPHEVLEQVQKGTDLPPAELQMWRSHPDVGRRLLERIPRLEEVAAWVGEQPTDPTAADAPGPPPGEDIAACLLPAAVAFLVHSDAGVAARDAARRLAETGRYPAPVLEAVLAAVAKLIPQGVIAEVRVNGLLPDMVIEDDVRTVTGLVLVRRGERVTDLMITRLSNFAATVGVQEPFKVLVRT